MTLISDASSLILLGKITILETLIKDNKIIIPEKVYIEVIKGKEKSRFDAFLLERLVNEVKIKIKKLDKETYDKIWKLFGLWAGENEVLGLALKEKLPALIDNKKSLNACKAAGINCITSLDIIIALYKKNKINKQKAEKSLELLDEYGWYKKDIIKFYKEKLK